jgi:hypothetical protein
LPRELPIRDPEKIAKRHSSDSNEIDESLRQSEKHDEQRISTLRGISIDSSEEDENAFDSICFNLEFDSN